jgi:hypothetical protein
LEKELVNGDIDAAIDRFPPCIVKPGFSPLGKWFMGKYIGSLILYSGEN